MKVSDILSVKGSKVMTVRPTESIATLARRLRLERVGAMIVSEHGNTADGIVSERDVVHGFAEHGSELQDLPVSKLMARAVTTCSPDDSIAKIAGIMTRHRIRHVPVLKHGELVGVISVGDVVKHRLDEIELEANVLRDYAIARQ